MEGLPPRAERTDTKDPASGALLLAALGLFSLGTLAVVGPLHRRPCVDTRLPATRPRRRGRPTRSWPSWRTSSFCTCPFVAVRGLLRAHVSTAEATAIGDIRTMIAAQAAYASRNDGRYEPRLECLVQPAKCLPGYPAGGEPFLGLRRWRPCGRRAGYRRAFRPGPQAPPRAAVAGRSPASRESRASRTRRCRRSPGETGVRGFCGDSTALLCFTTRRARAFRHSRGPVRSLHLPGAEVGSLAD